ncbi:MAG: hypothetical protein HY676_05015 [Chloroflexi bacterium]|nr:hypothetical protein [Chloroflexota bacterium]
MAALYEMLIDECSEELLELGEKQFRQWYMPGAEVKLSPSALHLHTAFCCALAALEKRRTSQSYTERFQELLEYAQRSILLFPREAPDGADDENFQWIKEEIRIMGAIINGELFNLRFIEGRYEDALWHFSKTYFELGSVERDLGYLKPQDAVDCFERIRQQPHIVTDWKRVAQNCRAAGDWIGEWDIGPDLDVPLIDSQGNKWWSHRLFWGFATGFATSRLTPDQLRSWKESEEQEHADRHMETLFFPGQWKQLPEAVRDALTQADVVWWSRDRSTKSAVIENLWKATVEIVRETLWAPFVEHVRSHPREELLMLKLDELQKKPSWEPSLGDFLHLMFKESCFDSFMRSHQVSKDDKDFLSSIDRHLGKLNSLRRKSVHPREGEVVQAQDVEWTYRTFLGVGCQGILPRLARIQLKG